MGIFWKLLDQITEIFGQFMISENANYHFYQVLVAHWINILSENSNAFNTLTFSNIKIELL